MVEQDQGCTQKKCLIIYFTIITSTCCITSPAYTLHLQQSTYFRRNTIKANNVVSSSDFQTVYLKALKGEEEKNRPSDPMDLHFDMKWSKLVWPFMWISGCKCSLYMKHSMWPVLNCIVVNNGDGLGDKRTLHQSWFELLNLLSAICKLFLVSFLSFFRSG